MNKAIQALAVCLCLLAGLAGGYLAWMRFPAMPERSVAVPAGERLLWLSTTGNRLITWDRELGTLSLRDWETGHPTHQIHLSPKLIRTNTPASNVGPFFSVSTDDRWLVHVAGGPDEPELLLVDLAAAAAAKPILVCKLPPLTDRYSPNPRFLANGRFLTYLLPGERRAEDSVNHARCDACLYDVSGKRELMRFRDSRNIIVPTSGPLDWVHVETSEGIERWDVAKREKLKVLPRWHPPGFGMFFITSTPDGAAIRLWATTEMKPPPHRFALYRRDLFTAESGEPGSLIWEHKMPSAATSIYWQSNSWPERYLLVKTLDEVGNLVQDLLDPETGRTVVRYPRPLDMDLDMGLAHLSQELNTGAGPVQTVGSTGEIAIDAGSKVIVSKQRGAEPLWWRHFPTQLQRLGFTRPTSPLSLQWHSARTGQLLEQVPLRFKPTQSFDRGEPKLAVHPTEPLMAFIDEGPAGELELQFWSMPPRNRPWGLVVALALAAACAAGAALQAAFRLWRASFRRPVAAPPVAGPDAGL